MTKTGSKAIKQSHTNINENVPTPLLDSSGTASEINQNLFKCTAKRKKLCYKSIDKLQPLKTISNFKEIVNLKVWINSFQQSLSKKIFISKKKGINK